MNVESIIICIAAFVVVVVVEYVNTSPLNGCIISILRERQKKLDESRLCACRGCASCAAAMATLLEHMQRREAFCHQLMSPGELWFNRCKNIIIIALPNLTYAANIILLLTQSAKNGVDPSRILPSKFDKVFHTLHGKRL